MKVAGCRNFLSSACSIYFLILLKNNYVSPTCPQQLVSAIMKILQERTSELICWGSHQVGIASEVVVN